MPSRRDDSLRRFVLEQAHHLGFELAGVAGVAPSARLALFPDWMAAGRAGEMDYLGRRGENGRFLREAVREAWPWARSVICVGMVYHTGGPRPSPDPARGWLSRYVWGDDYHQVVRQRLVDLMAELSARLRAQAGTELAEAECKITVDTAPLIEREAARQAGVGWQGKNTCLIHPGVGSYFFLGTIVTSLAMATDAELPDRCGSCTRCIEACPTQALEPYRMDASRCLAYLNIELRGSIPERFRAAMGDNLLGCDICQDVCPWNERAAAHGTQSQRPEFQPRTGLFAPLLEELAAMTEDEYRAKFRHSAAKRAKYAGLRRNLAIVMGNSGNPSFRPRLEEWSSAEDVTLSQTARWALAQLEPVSPAE